MGWKSHISRQGSSGSGRERRAHARFRTSLSVLAGGGQLAERRYIMIDVSEGGALLQPNLDLPEHANAEIRLAGGRSAEVRVLRQSTAGTAVTFAGKGDDSGLIADLIDLARISGPCRPEVR